MKSRNIETFIATSGRNLEIAFGGATLLLDGAGALYWPDYELLVVSDMHLEKSTYLATHGSFIPPYDTLDTLDRLNRLIAYYTPKRLLFLGDSFHDHQAWVRLDIHLRERILALTETVEECLWIEGNHDITLANHGLHRFLPHHECAGLHFRHDHLPMEAPQIIGHFHPKTTLSLGIRYLRASCFALTSRLLIMPAFGSYTGGLDLGHEAFKAIGNGERYQPYLIHKDRVYKL